METDGQKNLLSCALPNPEERDRPAGSCMCSQHPHGMATPDKCGPAVDGPGRDCQAWQGQQCPWFAMQLAPTEDTMLRHRIGQALLPQISSTDD